MTINEARSYGGYQIIKAAAILLLLIEVLGVLHETDGDFANGILFFIGGQVNIYFFSLVAVSFSTLYLFGRQAATKIVGQNKSPLKIGLFFGLISTVLIIFYMTIAILLLNESRSPGYNLENQTTIRQMILSIAGILLIPMILIWLYATRRIKVENLK